MTNLGAWPIDPTTTTGLFRFEVGDVVGVPLDNDPNQATFEFMSDAVIDALMAANADRDTAKALALTSMATQLIAAAQDIQVSDIKIRTVERATLMLNLAATLSRNAAAGTATFTTVPLVSASLDSYPTQPYAESGF